MLYAMVVRLYVFLVQIQQSVPLSTEKGPCHVSLNLHSDLKYLTNSLMINLNTQGALQRQKLNLTLEFGKILN